VVDAIREGRFQIWAIDSIDEGIELLTGMPAGAIDEEGTFHHRLDQRLREFLTILQEQPSPGLASRVRFGPVSAPKPTPPPLPGQV